MGGRNLEVSMFPQGLSAVGDMLMAVVPVVGLLGGFLVYVSRRGHLPDAAKK